MLTVWQRVMRKFATVLVLAAMVLLAGCTQSPESGPMAGGNNGDAVSVAIDNARKALAVRDAGLTIVTDEDNGKTVNIAAGEKLIVELLSNGTTGYCWKVIEDNNGLLSLAGHEYIVPDYPPGFCGGSGIERFEFLCLAGSGQLKLVYQRSFAPQADDKVYSLVVNANAK